MKKHLTMLLCLVLAVTLFGCRQTTFRIGVTLPADNTDVFFWSDEEICPKGRKITVRSCDEMGDVEFILKPVEVREENAYDEPVIISRGKSVTLNAEKGAWYRIGIRMLNGALPDQVKYLEIEGIEVRIASETPNMGGAENRRMAVCIDNIMYYNTEVEVPVEPDESAIEYVEIPAGGGAVIDAFARLENGALFVCRINGEWYKFVPEYQDAESGSAGQALSVGIIGGADGPTVIMVSGSANWLKGAAVFGFAAAMVAVGIILFCKKRKKEQHS